MGIFSRFKKPNLSFEDLEIKNGYLRLFPQKFSGKASIRDATFTVLDTETSGLDVKNDKLLSIAALKVSNFNIKIESSFEGIIIQEDYKPGEDVKIHGLLKRDIKTGEGEKSVLQNLLVYLGNDVIVGHHIAFDVAILNRSLKKHFDVSLKNKVLDTATLAKRIENPLSQISKTISLDELCIQYGVPIDDRHTAAADTFITAMVFMKMLGNLERRGVGTMVDLL